MDFDVFVTPPEDIRKPGVVWRLKKPLYGLEDASRKFWLRVKDVFCKVNMKTMDGDKAFYFQHQGEVIQGCIITYVNDFKIAGRKDFVDRVLNLVEVELTISKIERDNFRYTGLDISTVKEGIEIEMKDYVNSLQDVGEIRKVAKNEDLTKSEFKEFRKITRKISWLANSTRPDLSYTALAMSKKNNSAKISDLRSVSRVL